MRDRRAEMQSGAAPGSVAEALRVTVSSLCYLISGGAAELGAAACGEALVAFGEVRSKLAAAHADAAGASLEDLATITAHALAQKQRFHDALQLACTLLPRVCH